GSLFSRLDYDRSGGFREGLAEDWDLWIRMIRKGVEVRLASHATVLYRWSDTSSAAEGTYDWYVEVLERARREATLPDEKRMVDRGIRAVAAADAVVRAYGEARAGRMWQA